MKSQALRKRSLYTGGAGAGVVVSAGLSEVVGVLPPGVVVSEAVGPVVTSGTVICPGPRVHISLTASLPGAPVVLFMTSSNSLCTLPYSSDAAR